MAKANTTGRRNIADNFNRLSARTLQTTDRRQMTDGWTMTYSERERLKIWTDFCSILTQFTGLTQGWTERQNTTYLVHKKTKMTGEDTNGSGKVEWRGEVSSTRMLTRVLAGRGSPISERRFTLVVILCCFFFQI